MLGQDTGGRGGETGASSQGVPGTGLLIRAAGGTGAEEGLGNRNTNFSGEDEESLAC